MIIKVCYQSKGDQRIVQLRSRKKSSEILWRKKELKNIIKEEFSLDVIAMLYINSNGIICIKNSEYDKPIIVTHDNDL